MPWQLLQGDEFNPTNDLPKCFSEWDSYQFLWVAIQRIMRRGERSADGSSSFSLHRSRGKPVDLCVTMYATASHELDSLAPLILEAWNLRSEHPLSCAQKPEPSSLYGTRTDHQLFGLHCQRIRFWSPPCSLLRHTYGQRIIASTEWEKTNK